MVVEYENDEIEKGDSALFWDGEQLLDGLDGQWGAGEVTDRDLYHIEYTFMDVGNFNISDSVYEGFSDLFEMDLASRWYDMTKPITFLIQLRGEVMQTMNGSEYDEYQECIGVVDNLEALVVVAQTGR